MEFLILIFNSFLLGVGLAMDAFSVSVGNGLNEPGMKWHKQLLIAGTFGVFQGFMPLAGWFLVHTAESKFDFLQKIIPWLAFGVLLFLGIKMIVEGIKNYNLEDRSEIAVLGIGTLMLQGIATSIDALSVGLAIAGYNASEALICSLIIAVITFMICIAGVKIGAKLGKFITRKASILGGCILVIIAVEILVSSFN